MGRGKGSELLGPGARPAHQRDPGRRADPVAGGWYLYGFPTPGFPDYPKIGVWPDGYYMSSNQFNSAGSARNPTSISRRAGCQLMKAASRNSE